MVFPRAVKQPKTCAELGVQAFRTIPHDLQAAASYWPLGSEARHDHVSSRPHDPLCLSHISGSIPRVSQEVEYSSIVPDGTGCAR
jgi:hypothetical protein